MEIGGTSKANDEVYDKEMMIEDQDDDLLGQDLMEMDGEGSKNLELNDQMADKAIEKKVGFLRRGSPKLNRFSSRETTHSGRHRTRAAKNLRSGIGSATVRTNLKKDVVVYGCIYSKDIQMRREAWPGGVVFSNRWILDSLARLVDVDGSGGTVEETFNCWGQEISIDGISFAFEVEARWAMENMLQHSTCELWNRLQGADSNDK
ncbi:hypothetical protein Bca52824_047732 [Brassica carinata]|uniref:Uncharacterized protein n=1 Tax=Brassica carinata TaxID=52824 RepID=A0A8X7RF66_BRACI|nr:hypothetical protein Bca52824_047732 [Brassica carinata]